MIREPQKGELHPTVPIRINEKGAFIDKEMVPVIRELNKIGLKTAHCCQGSKTVKHHYGRYKDLRGNLIQDAYISFKIDDHTHFEFDEDTGHLIIRWRRYHPDPYLPYPHLIRRFQNSRIHETTLDRIPLPSETINQEEDDVGKKME